MGQNFELSTAFKRSRFILVYRSICLRGGDVSQHRLPVAGLRVESVLSYAEAGRRQTSRRLANISGVYPGFCLKAISLELSKEKGVPSTRKSCRIQT